MALPELFVERLQAIVPPDVFPDVLRAFSEEKTIGVRVNALKTTSAAMQALWRDADVAVKPITGLQDAFWVPAKDRALWTHSSWVDEGLIYLQDRASQWAVHALNPKEDEEVLDLCAAPGGKATQLAAWLGGTGSIGAVEAVRGRFFKLKATVVRMGADNIRLYHKDGRFIDKACPNRFDAILLDAPCSTEACIVANDPSTYRYWGAKKIKAMAKKQQALLFSAIGALKPGGRLLYVTCSFAPEENECVLQKALERFDQMTLLPLVPPKGWRVMAGLSQWQGKTFVPSMDRVCRLLPDGDSRGLTIALMEKA